MMMVNNKMTQPIKFARFLERTLPNLNVEFLNPEIRGIYGGQLGHMVLSPAAFVALEESGGLTLNQLLDVSDNDDADVGDRIGKELLTALEKSPHTFGLKKDRLPNVEIYQSNYLRYSFQFSEPLTFSIKVPASKKKFDFIDDEIEQFDVLMMGSNHITFVELDDCPEQIFIGQEFREQVRELLDSPSNTFRLGQIGPSPIHPRIYVIDISNDNFTQREIYSYDDDLYVLVNLKLGNATVTEIYQDILELSGFELDQFYSLSKFHSLLLDLHQAIHQQLQQTVNAYMQLGTNFFLMKFWKLAELRMDLLRIHKGSLEFELQLANYENYRKRFLSKLDDNMFLEDMEPYFSEITEPELPMANALFKTLEYMEKSISSADVAIRTISATVIGAAFGFVVTLLWRL